jgi:hypothetical protein
MPDETDNKKKPVISAKTIKKKTIPQSVPEPARMIHKDIIMNCFAVLNASDTKKEIKAKEMLTDEPVEKGQPPKETYEVQVWVINRQLNGSICIMRESLIKHGAFDNAGKDLVWKALLRYFVTEGINTATLSMALMLEDDKSNNIITS